MPAKGWRSPDVKLITSLFNAGYDAWQIATIKKHWTVMHVGDLVRAARRRGDITRKSSTRGRPSMEQKQELHVTRVEGDEIVCYRCKRRWDKTDKDIPECITDTTLSERVIKDELYLQGRREIGYGGKK